MKFVKLTYVLTLFSLLNFGFTATSIAQKKKKYRIYSVDFTASNSAYNMYYPSNFNRLEYDTNNRHFVELIDTSIATFIKVIDYSTPTPPPVQKVIDLLSSLEKDMPKSNWKSYKYPIFDNLVEGRIDKTGEYWAWWGVSRGRRIIVISMKKLTPIHEEDIKMIRLLIENIQIH